MSFHANTASGDTQVSALTARTSGAVAIIQLHGPGTREILQTLTGCSQWPAGRAVLVDFDDFDQGLVICDSPQTSAQLMPHGGVRVVARLMDRLVELGASHIEPASLDARTLFPEAANQLEAEALRAVSTAASPAAVDLLLSQPACWRWLNENWLCVDDALVQRMLESSRRLGQLLHPPTIAITGQPNVGKSTLTNAMLGRNASVVADLPGTTRDWVAGMAQLPSQWGLVAVRWLDTPGQRQSDDMIEQQAITMAQRVIGDASVVVAMRDAQTPWLEQADTARAPDLWVVNKAESRLTQESQPAQDDGRSPDKPLYISAKDNLGLDHLAACIVERLGLGGTDQAWLSDSPCCWAFTPELAAILTTRDEAGLARYLSESA